MRKLLQTAAAVLVVLIATPAGAMSIPHVSDVASLLDIQRAEMNPNTTHHCQPGMHAIRSPSKKSGYRCVHNR
jgi:hypothetical protein